MLAGGASYIGRICCVVPLYLSASSGRNSRPSCRSRRPGRAGFHEIKYDGYRTLIVIDRGQVRAFTRNGNDWTRAYKWRVGVCRFRDIAAAIQMPGRIGEKFAAMAIERLNRRHYF